MFRQICRAGLAFCVMGLWGCTARPVDSFTLEVDLPAEFELKTAANYRPATGELCTLPRRRGKRPERKVFFTEFTPVASRVSYQLPLTETVDGCPLVLRNVAFDFNAKWGKRSTDVGGAFGGIPSAISRRWIGRGCRNRASRSCPGNANGCFERQGHSTRLSRFLNATL